MLCMYVYIFGYICIVLHRVVHIHYVKYMYIFGGLDLGLNYVALFFSVTVSLMKVLVYACRACLCDQGRPQKQPMINN